MNRPLERRTRPGHSVWRSIWRPVWRSIWRSVFRAAAIIAIPALAGLTASPDAGAREPAANEVVLLGGPGGGASRTWLLEEGQPFLAVPYLGPDLAGAVATVELGAAVGVALFESPFFQSADETCEYRLGGPEHPDLWWLSRGTALLPADGATGVAEAALGGREVASMIVYKRALGPPPGALLLEERRYINWDCDKPSKARAYNRLFVPVPQAPHSLGCFNLATALESEGFGRIGLDFLAAGALVLLLPGDADEALAAVEHRLAATLFDGESCAGASVAVAHPQSGGRRFKLRDFGFARKARSLLLSYEGGAYDPYLPPPNQRTRAPVTEFARARPAAQTSPAAAQTSPSATGEPAATQTSPAAAGEPATSTSPSADMPASLTRSLAEQETGIPDPPAAPADSGGTGASAQSSAQTSAPSSAQSSAGASSGAAAATTDPGTVQTGLLIPPGGVPEAAVGSRTFAFPLLQGYRLHACLRSDRDCGEPAASEWCRGLGFRAAASWTLDENIGSLFPTLAIGDLGLCANFVCDGFQEITCAR